MTELDVLERLGAITSEDGSVRGWDEPTEPALSPLARALRNGAPVELVVAALGYIDAVGGPGAPRWRIALRLHRVAEVLNRELAWWADDPEIITVPVVQSWCEQSARRQTADGSSALVNAATPYRRRPPPGPLCTDRRRLCSQPASPNSPPPTQGRTVGRALASVVALGYRGAGGLTAVAA